MSKTVTTVDFADMERHAGEACNLLKAMANEARLLVLCQLFDGEKTVGELQEAVGLSQSAMSQHLAVLREQGVVATRREGQSIHYRISSPEATAIMETLHGQLCRPKRRS